VDRLLDRLHHLAAEAGVTALGVCRADPFTETRAHLAARIEAGHHAGMGFTFRDPDRSTSVRESLPWAGTLVVAGHTYLPAAGAPGPGRSGTARVARFATADHYRPLRAALEVIATELREAGGRAEVLVDDARLVDRAAAVRAGIGWWGKNTMVLAPGSGPWMLLGSVATDLALPISNPMQRDCGTCEACLPACPTGALVAPGVLDAGRCLAHAAQASGVIPRALREPMGDRWYGCDDCLEACPPGSRLLEAALDPAGRVDLLRLLAMSDRDLLAGFSHFYIPGRRPRYLRRNALVALGNTGGPGALAVAAGFAGHPDWLLRAHAVWALGRLGGPVAERVLAARAAAEGDDRVQGEIEHTAQGGGG
jgi:epoxyqueuosine reductase